jgi:uncharacterized protein
MQKIVIAGGSGLIGRFLLKNLHAEGYDATALKRPYSSTSLSGATTIINLAGESLSTGRWTPVKKKMILESRTEVLKSLKEILQNNPNTVKNLISASAIGYYGSTTSDHIYHEDDPCGNDFLAAICSGWESAADSFEALGVRVVKIRIGIVLSRQGGALPKLMIPLKFGVSTPLGSGKQWMPWIHMDDLSGIFLHAIQHQDMSGPFNAVAPGHITNRDFMKELAVHYHRLFIPFGVPAFLMKALIGEMATITLEGSRISSEKILNAGYRFKHPNLIDAF